jgi:hypothetical protein
MATATATVAPQKMKSNGGSCGKNCSGGEEFISSKQNGAFSTGCEGFDEGHDSLWNVKAVNK